MAKRPTGKAYYMISAVSQKYSIHPQTLRLYEREGLLKPSRTEGNTRLYSDEDLEQLETILALTRDLGVNLAGGIGTTDRGERGLFALGGFPSFTPAQFLDAIRLGYQGGAVALRGYAPQSRAGSQYQLANVEYRFPVVQVQRASGTIPLFLQRISGDVFCDAGYAGYGVFQPSRVAVGAGAELLIDVVVGFILPFTLRTGYAHGFMEDGSDQVYGLLSSPF